MAADRRRAALSFLLDLPDAACAARRRRAGARRRPARRGRWHAGAAARDPLRRPAASGAHRLASRQPPPADVRSSATRLRIRRDHVHRRDAARLGAKRDRDRGAVRSRRRRLRGGGHAHDAHSHDAHDHDHHHHGHAARRTTTTTELSAAALYRLMTWLSPAYPVGAFSYSSGIEWAVEAGDITDAGDAAALARRRCSATARGFNDAILFAHAYRAAADGDDAALREVAELAAAFVPTARAASRNDRAGPRLRRRDVAPPGRAPRSTRLHGIARRPDRLSGRGRRRLRRPRHPAASRRCTPFCTPSPPTGFPPACGSSRSARPTASACSPRSSRSIARTAQRALAATLDDLGSATFRADIASMRHETQYTRLFRS